MTDDQKEIVIGDETAFLERARAAGVSPARIADIAGTLAPLCGDPAFAKQLRALAGG